MAAFMSKICNIVKLLLQIENEWFFFKNIYYIIWNIFKNIIINSSGFFAEILKIKYV